MKAIAILKDLVALRKRWCWFGFHRWTWSDDPFVGMRYGHSHPWLFQPGRCARCNKLKVREVGPPRAYTESNGRATVTPVLRGDPRP